MWDRDEVCVCVSEREREREREMIVCVCVCEKRERNNLLNMLYWFNHLHFHLILKSEQGPIQCKKVNPWIVRSNSMKKDNLLIVESFLTRIKVFVSSQWQKMEKDNNSKSLILSFWNGSHAIPMQRPFFQQNIIPKKCKLGHI